MSGRKEGNLTEVGKVVIMAASGAIMPFNCAWRVEAG